MNPALSSLVLGERVAARCEDGLLQAEYALFDRNEVILAGTVARGAREHGYMTTAGFARARLEAAGISAGLAKKSFEALRAKHLRVLALTPAVLRVVEQLGPCEVFEGGTFSVASGRYAGTWLDLDALATACPLRGASAIIQALHLRIALDELDEDVPVRLLTAEANENARPGERTWRRVSFDAAPRLPSVLQAMRAPARSLARSRDEADVREELLRNLRERATASAAAQPRLTGLAALFARMGRTPPLGSARSEPPEPIARPSPPPPPDQPPLFDELRRHTELLRGEDHLRAVAQFLSAMSQRSTTLPELAILAARAWLAAGEPALARHFARLLAENADATDGARMIALEILDSTAPTSESMHPPPPGDPIPTYPAVVVVPEADRHAPPGASLPPHALVLAQRRAEPVPPLRPLVTRAAPARAEIVETLSLPEGAQEEMLAWGAPPSDPLQARIAMTRLARDLGRDYRLWYGSTLKTDPVAIDAMQRHLRRRFADGEADPRHARELEAELTRHGALLGEILARSLDAEWVDVSSDQPGHWAMVVPPDLRVWPIGRVYRFFRQGHRESDLVAFYFEVQAHRKNA